MTVDIESLSVQVGSVLRERGWLLVTAESCTGGGVAAAVTDIAGSSEWFERGFVTYSNRAKQEVLGVPADTLARHGAVSGETVAAMVAGALARTPAGIALAVSGVAGPGGGSPGKPVGTVWFAWGARDGLARTVVHHLAGDRAAVRRQSVAIALQGILDLAADSAPPVG